MNTTKTSTPKGTVMDRQQKLLLKLRTNLEQSIEKAELDCSPLELAQLKKCHSEINQLCANNEIVRKDTLEEVASSISVLSHQSNNQTVEKTALGMHMLVATS